jgi:hypothetical protein
MSDQCLTDKKYVQERILPEAFLTPPERRNASSCAWSLNQAEEIKN